jgi:hypothetical protein
VAQVQGSTDLEARFLAHYRMPDVPAGAGSGRRA